jgi:hypothetical protein
MEEKAKRRVHISWNEAQRAEAEREKTRQERYKLIPAPSLMKVIAAHVSRDLPRLKATAMRLWTVKFH